jgi:hypothetical protein
MACIDEHTRGRDIYGFINILPMVHRRFFEDSKSNHKIAQEKKKFVWIEKCVE